MSLQPINSPTTWKRAQTSINANFTALVNALAGPGTVDATDPVVTALLTDNGSGAYTAVEGIVEDVADGVVAGLVTDSSDTRTALDSRFTPSAVQPINLAQIAPAGSSNVAEVQAVLDDLDAAGGGTLVIPKGTWTFTGSVGLSLTGTTNPIHIHAEPGAVFDMTGLTATNGITLGGGQTATTASLASDASKGDMTLAATIAVSPGDVLLIRSTDAWEPTIAQDKGEFVEVASYSSGTITLKSALYDNYTAATTTVTKLNMPRVQVTGNLTIRRNSNHCGVRVEYARDLNLDGLHVTGAREALIRIAYIYGGVVQNCSGTDFWYSGSGTSYGLVVNSSQHIVEAHNRFKGGRHAVAHGGLWPCRDIQVIGGTFDNHHPSGIACFDFHANCEDVKVIGATILNGLLSHASNFEAIGCTIIGVNRRGAELYAPRDCDYIKIIGGSVSTFANEGVVLLPRNNPGAAHRCESVVIDTQVKAFGAAVSLIPASASDDDWTIGKLTLRGRFENYGGTTSAVLALTASAAYVNVEVLDLDGDFLSAGSHCIGLDAGGGGLVRATGRFTSGGSTYGPFRVGATWDDVEITDATLAGASGHYRSNFANTGNVWLRNVTIRGASSAGGIAANAGPVELLVSNVAWVNSTGTPLGPARTVEGYTQTGGAVATMSAAPTGGTWKRGDRVYNSTPSAAGKAGWVCTAAGTPGTWKAFGVIDA